ncbi:hypothetical protein [Sphingomonas sp.]|uniref:hypothetical protein n=1 Tax=Sphingomonas sp. TaxID=28214 RepID=UPI0025CFEA4E|nr:hypothetical protein [Sphingomonas sp.]
MMAILAPPPPPPPSGPQTVSFQAPGQPDPQVDATSDLENSQRTRALAAALRQQSFDAIPDNGGNISWTQGVAKLAQALVASRLEHKANVGEWDAHAKQQAARRAVHYGDATPADLSANPFRSDHERAHLVKALRNLSSQANGAQPPSASPAAVGVVQLPGNNTPIAVTAAPIGNATPSIGPQPGNPGAPPLPGGGPGQPSGSSVQPPVRMDRMLSSMPADAGMYFEQSDPEAYWRAVGKTQEPADDERYASHFGQSGSKEFNSALQDYRLRSFGPSAIDAKGALMGDRYGYMGELQDDRLRSSERNTDVRTEASVGNNIRSTGVTSRGQDLSHNDRMRGQDFSHQDRTRGQDMTDSRVRGSAAFQGTGGRGHGGAPAVAVGPNGHKIVVQNGRWVDAQTGVPVQ